MFEVSISRQILHYYIFKKNFVNVKTHNFYQMLNKNKIFYIIAIIHFNLFFFFLVINFKIYNMTTVLIQICIRFFFLSFSFDGIMDAHRCSTNDNCYSKSQKMLKQFRNYKSFVSHSSSFSDVLYAIKYATLIYHRIYKAHNYRQFELCWFILF